MAVATASEPPSTYPSVRVSICASIHPSVHISIHVPVHSCTCPFIRVHIHASIHTLVLSFLRLPEYPSVIHVHIHPFICAYIHPRPSAPTISTHPFLHAPVSYPCAHPSMPPCTHPRAICPSTYSSIHPSINAPGRHSSTAYHIRRVCFLLIKLFAASTAIDHSLLWGTLSSLGSREGTFSWFHSYLSAPYMPKMEFPPLPPKCLSTGFFFFF